MKRIESTILFYNEPWCKIYTTYPFKSVEIEPINPKCGDEEELIDYYHALINDESILIRKDEEPLKYVAYLYQGLSGSYFRATESEIIDEDEILKKQLEDPNILDVDIPNIDYYPETLNWLQSMRKKKKKDINKKKKK